MKYVLLSLLFIPSLLPAQVTHSIGVGSFMNFSKLVNTDEALDSIPGYTQSGRINFSPFLEYTLGINRFNASLGVGFWQNGVTQAYS